MQYEHDLIAAGLDAQGECGAPGQARRDLGAARAVAVAKPLRRRQAYLLRQPIFAIVRNYLNDTRKCGDFVRPPRRIAAGHDDSGARILARDLPDDLPRALIRRAGDRAGIHDDHIGIVWCRYRPARADQLLLDLEGIGLIDAAPERDDRILQERYRWFSSWAASLHFFSEPALVLLDARRDVLVAERQNLRGEHTRRSSRRACRSTPSRPARPAASGPSTAARRVRSSAEESIGTPMTGFVTCAATTPPRCAAAPAPTMNTLTPRVAASPSSRITRSGERCADATVISTEMPSSFNTSTAPCMTGASFGEPMRMRTCNESDKRFGSDIFSIVHAVETDFTHGRYARSMAVSIITARGDDRQDAAAGSHNIRCRASLCRSETH